LTGINREGIGMKTKSNKDGQKPQHIILEEMIKQEIDGLSELYHNESNNEKNSNTLYHLRMSRALLQIFLARIETHENTVTK
jgi:hypothetical protein